MKRVIVIGSPGAGKSTFSRALRDKTGLPLHHLDMLWHRADKTTVSREEFDQRLIEICKGERWILDGNFARTLELRLQYCDTAILLDYPTELCLASVAARIGKPREDMPWTETEFEPEFRAYIEAFGKERLPQMYEVLEKYRDSKNIIVFKDRASAQAYLDGSDKE